MHRKFSHSLKQIIMKTILTITFSIFTLFTVNCFGQDALLKNSGDLINQIMKGADVNEDQAKGGAGALFEMAKGKMDKLDFDKVSDVVPNMGGMLDAIPALGQKKSMLGTTAIALTGMPKVVAVFDKLGISQDKVSLFTPIIVKYVENKGGAALGKVLGNSLK